MKDYSEILIEVDALTRKLHDNLNSHQIEDCLPLTDELVWAARQLRVWIIDKTS